MRLAVIVLISLTLLAYGDSLRSGWHLDDNHTIVRNERIGDLPAALRNAILTNRGLADLTFTLNWLASGDDPVSYHAVNLLIHLANGFLLLLLVRRLAEGHARRDALSAGTAALFLLHPLATNAVTYVVQRYTSLACFFFLLSVLSYARGRDGHRGAAVLSVAAALAAARTKESVLTLPLVLVLLEGLWPRGAGPRRFLRILPHAVAVGIIPLTLIAGRMGFGESLSEAMGRVSRETPEIGRTTYALTQVHVVTTYIRLIAAPVGLTLDHDYPLTHAPDLATFGKALLLAALAGLAFHLRRRSPLAAFGIGWFFLTLLVESSIFPIRDVLFEHRTYLPSAGLFAAALAGVSRLVPSNRLLFAGIAVVSIGLTGLTAGRNRVWKDEITLWSDCVAKAPRKARPYANLGYAWIDKGDTERAIDAMETSVRLGNPFPEDLVTLAELHYGAGRTEQAEDALRRALEIRPAYGRARRNLAQILAERGDMTAALREAEETIRREPAYGSGWLLLARLRLEAGDSEGFRAAASEAEQVEGDRAEIALLRARDLAASGDGSGAIRELSRWREGGTGGNPEDAARVVRALVDEGLPPEAAAAASLAGAAFPDDPRFPYYAGAILLASARTEEAVASLREAVRLSPSQAEIRSLLARALHESGRRGEAEREAAETLRLDPSDPGAAEILRERGGDSR